MDPLKRFHELQAMAETAISHPNSTGCPDIESAGLAIIDLVKAHPDLRPQFVQLFVQILHKDPWELLAFCMHVLRWPEMYAIVHQQHIESVTKIGSATSNVYQHVLDSFSDDWEDADMFPYFGGRRSSGP